MSKLSETLTEDKWCQGSFQTDDGRQCLLTMLNPGEVELIHGVLNKKFSYPRSIIGFNDDEVTTFKDVIGVLREAGL